MSLRFKLKKKLAPGLWQDTDGNAHFDIPELLRVSGLSNTPENRQMAVSMARELLKIEMPDLKVIDLGPDQN